jgi:hypothetical protein
MFVYFPECIYQHIKEDEDYIQINQYIQQLNSQIKNLQDLFKSYNKLYRISKFTKQQTTLSDTLNYLIHQYCPQYDFLWSIFCGEYDINQLQKFQKYEPNLHIKLYIIEQILSQMSREDSLYFEYCNQYINVYPYLSIQDPLLKDWYFYYKNLKYIYEQLNSKIQYDIYDTLHIHTYLKNTHTHEELTPHAYSLLLDLYNILLSSVCMKYSKYESEIKQDFNMLIPDILSYQYEYHQYDIRKLRLLIRFITFYIIHKEYDISKLYYTICNEYLNIILRNLDQFQQANLILHNKNDIALMSIIYYMLKIKNLIPDNQTDLQYLSNEDTQYILLKQFLKSETQRVREFQNDKMYWKRNFLSIEKFLTNINKDT